jgi:bla regulator protein blaR1
MIPSPIANHVWQSTAFAAAAGLLALAFQKNAARTRHWLWFMASVKFLVPFGVLSALGARFGVGRPSLVETQISTAVTQISEPFAPPAYSVAAAPAPGISLETAALTIWAMGCAAILLHWFIRWRRASAALAVTAPLDLGIGIRAFTTRVPVEPSVFGILRPALLLPEGIARRLTPEQLQAIVAHELCHVRQRDNLLAAIHSVVEAVFWFHPLVWWIGARLVEERERACDEEVLKLGNDPETYAESILVTCRFHLETPLAFTTGVTSGDLKRRIEQIMSGGAAQSLTSSRKLLLTAAGIAAVAGPIAYGVIDAPLLRAQSPSEGGVPKVEVATIKPSTPGQRGFAIIPEAGGKVRTQNTTLKQLLLAGFHLHEAQLAGGPDWLDRDRFDIVAQAEGHATLSEWQLGNMFANLVTERFQLKFHRETRQMPYFALTQGKGGSKLKASDKTEGPSIRNRRAITAPGGTMEQLANLLGWVMGRPVLDRTGLGGRYEYHLEWTPDESNIPAEAAPATAVAEDPNGESILVAIQEQLGLKLVAGKGPVEILVIDHAEKPKGN